MHFIDLRVCDLLRVGDNAADTDEVLDSLVVLIEGSLLFFDDFFDSIEPFFGGHGQYLNTINTWTQPMVKVYVSVAKAIEN